MEEPGKPRSPVRTRPFMVLKELADLYACGECGTLVPVGQAWVVFMDAQRHGKNLKAESQLACCEACRDALYQSMTVEYGMVGVIDVEIDHG